MDPRWTGRTTLDPGLACVVCCVQRAEQTRCRQRLERCFASATSSPPPSAWAPEQDRWSSRSDPDPQPAAKLSEHSCDQCQTDPQLQTPSKQNKYVLLTVTEMQKPFVTQHYCGNSSLTFLPKCCLQGVLATTERVNACKELRAVVYYT